MSGRLGTHYWVNSSGRRNTSGRCGDGVEQAPARGSSFAAADVFARSSPGGTPGASAEVLGRSCSWIVERGVGGGGRRVSRCGDALVSRMWWHATFQSSSCVGALPIVRRARRDRRSSSPRSWRARDRQTVGPRSVNDLARTAAQRSHTRWNPRVSGHDRPMACRSESEASESCQAGCQRLRAQLATGSALGTRVGTTSPRSRTDGSVRLPRKASRSSMSCSDSGTGASSLAAAIRARCEGRL